MTGKPVLKRDGAVGDAVTGKPINNASWWRIYNGREDRGVPLGDWAGQFKGDESPRYRKKRLLQEWFASKIDGKEPT